MNPTLDGTRLVLRQRLTRLRRAHGARSVMAFAQTYLPAHFRLPPSTMHEQLFEMLESASSRRGIRLAVAAPRGHAKSRRRGRRGVTRGGVRAGGPEPVACGESAPRLRIPA